MGGADTGVMAHVSRPLIALLLATVVFFALWLVALKPGGSSPHSSGSGQALGRYQADINAAHQAVQTANAAGGSASGGGLVLAGNGPPITSSTFSGNQAIGGDAGQNEAGGGAVAAGGGAGSGGAIYATVSTILLNSTAANDTAQGGAGA